MSEQKRPLHAVLSYMLGRAAAGVSELRTSANATETRVILNALYNGRIDPEDAQKIAHDHADLPRTLQEVSQDALAQWADEVLFDLKGRRETEPDKP